ncbi:carbonic anhydrase [Hysterangium stoloniferum]|nr:carbonic anhydrase [Hysterangium stoloniferum]
MACKRPIKHALLDSNSEWACRYACEHPGFFEKSASKQTPQALWIGCSDSRIPESTILNCPPGVIFTHRNIANQFPLKDDNVHAVLEYAIEHLDIRHVCVVGHLGCGGVEGAYAAAKQRDTGDTALNRWLEELIQLILKNNFHLKPKEEALPLIVKENIKLQVQNVLGTDTVSKAAASGKPVYVHGWMYNLNNGKLEDLRVTRSTPHTGLVEDKLHEDYVWVL